MNYLNQAIEELKTQINEVPEEHQKELKENLWHGIELLNEGDFMTGDQIIETVARRIKTIRESS